MKKLILFLFLLRTAYGQITIPVAATFVAKRDSGVVYVTPTGLAAGGGSSAGSVKYTDSLNKYLTPSYLRLPSGFGRIDSSHLFITRIPLLYPIVASGIGDTIKLSKSFSDSVIALSGGVAAVSDINAGTDNVEKVTALGLEGSRYSFDQRGLNQYYFFNDFTNPPILANSLVGSEELASQVSGTGASVATIVTDAPNHPGIVQSSTGTTAAGLAILQAGLAGNIYPIKFTGGSWVFETLINIPTLSNSSQRYQYEAGFLNVNGSPNQTSGAYFLYDEGGVSTANTINSTASPNWQFCTAVSSGSGTIFVSSTAVSTGWTKLKVVINAAGTQADFYVNGSLIESNVTNLPNSTHPVGFGSLITKSIGTTASIYWIDYLSVQSTFTTNR